MQYENVFKVIGVVHVILAFLKLLLLLKLLRKMAAPGTGTGATDQMDQRLLTNTWPKTIHNINIHANNSKN